MAKSDYICCDRCDCKIVYDHDDRIAEGLTALGLDKAPALCETCRAAPSPAATEVVEALKEVMEWIDNWSPPFTDDDEWPATQAKVFAALRSAGEEANG